MAAFGRSCPQAKLAIGKHLFERDCATCHSPTGPTRLPGNQVSTPPSGSRTRSVPPFSTEASQTQRMIRMAQITKFGIPGTDMPGHEYLSDKEIASISLWLSQHIAQSSQLQKTPSLQEKTMKTLRKRHLLRPSFVLGLVAYAQHQSFDINPDASQVAFTSAAAATMCRGHSMSSTAPLTSTPAPKRSPAPSSSRRQRQQRRTESRQKNEQRRVEHRPFSEVSLRRKAIKAPSRPRATPPFRSPESSPCTARRMISRCPCKSISMAQT